MSPDNLDWQMYKQVNSNVNRKLNVLSAITMYDGRSINKLQIDTILLIFKI